MLKLKLQYFGHLMQRTDSLEKTPMLGKIEGRRKRGWHQLNRHEFEQALGVGDKQGSLASYSPWDGKELNTTEQLNWTIKILFFLSSLFCIFTKAVLNIIYFWRLFLGFSGPLISKKCVSHNFSHQFFMYCLMHTFSLFSFLKLYLHIT